MPNHFLFIQNAFAFSPFRSWNRLILVVVFLLFSLSFSFVFCACKMCWHNIFDSLHNISLFLARLLAFCLLYTFHVHIFNAIQSSVMHFYDTFEIGLCSVHPHLAHYTDGCIEWMCSTHSQIESISPTFSALSSYYLSFLLLFILLSAFYIVQNLLSLSHSVALLWFMCIKYIDFFLLALDHLLRLKSFR